MKYFLLLFVLLLLLTPAAARAEESTNNEIKVEVNNEGSSSGVNKDRHLKELRRINQLKRAEFERMRRDKESHKASFSAEMKKRKEEFVAKLAKIRDERKKTIVTNLNEKMKRINQQRTEHWKKVLARLQEYLNKIKSRRDEVKKNGKDTAEVDVLIDTAQTNIDAALLAVNNQATKEYVLNITTEQQLKNTVGASISSEQSDLRTAQRAVDMAKKSVKDALVALMKLKGDKVLENSSPSGQTSQ